MIIKMIHQKWLKLAVVSGLGLLLAFITYRMFTFHWDVDYIYQATSLTLYDPEETLTGSELQAFMKGFQANSTRQFDLQCTFRRRSGFVIIHDREYAVELLHDKFAGDVLILRIWNKTVELARAHR